VVPADIAVAGLASPLTLRYVLEDLDVRAVLASEHADTWNDHPGIHVEVFGHPVSRIIAKRPEGKDFLATDHIDEETYRFLQVGNREAKVIRAS
jgi:hypothetical protein